MASAIQDLTDYAVSITYDGIPADVNERAKACITDTVGVAVFGARFPWSQAILDYAKRSGSGGQSSLFGDGTTVHAPAAALANGALAHAFELDNLREPGAGVHPGATVVMPALAIAEETGASGRELISAVVAGCEVMFRIGVASKHTSEKLGFHAPGLTGPFGSAVACGKLLGLDGAGLANAMGIAGSLSSGLLEFAKSGTGGMVKRLHLGRAAEGGVLAASLAKNGFAGPHSILDGHFGFLNVYCADSDPSGLVAGLGETFETRRICMKRYACHVTAQTPVQSVRELMAEHGFTGDEVDALCVLGGEKTASHHNIPEPSDLMLAQYSVPFCVALALFRDPEDPANFSQDALNDPAIRDMAKRVRIGIQEKSKQPGMGWASTVEIALHDGRRLVRDAETFLGAPRAPLSPSDLQSKFLRLTIPTLGEKTAARLHDKFSGLEAISAL